MKTLMPLNLYDRTFSVSYTATLKMESTRVVRGAFISLELHENNNAFKLERSVTITCIQQP